MNCCYEAATDQSWMTLSKGVEHGARVLLPTQEGSETQRRYSRFQAVEDKSRLSSLSEEKRLCLALRENKRMGRSRG